MAHRPSEKPPFWVEHPPQTADTRYFVGEATHSPTKDEALASAWASALVRIGMAEFPELSTVQVEMSEHLRGASHERKFAMRLELVDWSGLQEATELGSPAVVWDDNFGRYRVYRLVRWGKDDIENARRKVRSRRIHALPVAPEAARRDEQKLVEAVRAVQALNERIERKDDLLKKVMGMVRCGATVSDLASILGPPDRSNPYARLEREYLWGSFEVVRAADSPFIISIRRTDTGYRRRLCNLKRAR